MLRHGYDLQRLNKPRIRIATTVAIALLTAAWFFLGSAAVSAAILRADSSPAALAVLGAIVTGNFVLLCLATVTAYRDPGRWGDAFVVVLLALNAVGSIVDQVGAWDLAYLVASLAALVLAIAAWRQRAATSRG